MRNVLASFVIVLAGACGGSQGEAVAPESQPAPSEPGAQPTGEAPAAEAEIQGPEKPWADMNRDERIAHMKMVVMPHMKQLFQAFDAEEFEEFGCVTCHGPGAKQGKFDMPAPGAIDKLNPADNFAAHQDHADELQFMMEKVAPQMAKLLGLPPYDPATNQGFGCGGCHEFVQ